MNAVVINLTILATLCASLFGRTLCDPTLDGNSIFGNMVEGFLKDLFKKEMRTVDNANMTDCMTRLLCESICRRTVSGQIKDPLINSKEIMGKDPSLPQNLHYLFAGGDKGYELGLKNQCHQCAQVYRNCEVNQYDSAKDLTDDNFSID